MKDERFMVLSDVTEVYPMGDTEVHALQGVDLQIEAGEFIAVLGPSGSGKSTVMHILELRFLQFSRNFTPRAGPSSL